MTFHETLSLPRALVAMPWRPRIKGVGAFVSVHPHCIKGSGLLRRRRGRGNTDRAAQVPNERGKRVSAIWKSSGGGVTAALIGGPLHQGSPYGAYGFRNARPGIKIGRSTDCVLLRCRVALEEHAGMMPLRQKGHSDWLGLLGKIRLGCFADCTHPPPFLPYAPGISARLATDR